MIEKTEGRSSRETEKLLLENVPGIEKTATRREKTQHLGNGRVEIKAIVSESCHKKLEELKDILSHKNPSMGYGGLLEILSELALDKCDPRRGKGKRKKKRAEGGQALVSGDSENRKREGDGASKPRAILRAAALSEPVRRTSLQKLQQVSGLAAKTSESAGQASAASAQKSQAKKQGSMIFATSAEKSQQTRPTFGASTQKPQWATRAPVASAPKLKQSNRYIPAAVKRLVWTRDKGCCSYVNPRTGRKCASRRFLQIYRFDFKIQDF